MTLDLKYDGPTSRGRFRETAAPRPPGPAAAGSPPAGNSVDHKFDRLPGAPRVLDR